MNHIAPLIIVLGLALVLSACGGAHGEAEINPEQIAEFGDASVDVQTDGDNVTVKTDVSFFLFGMPITVRAHDLVVDAGGDAANCLVVGASFAGAEFQWLAHDQHPLCVSLLASGALTIGAGAPAGD